MLFCQEIPKNQKQSRAKVIEGLKMDLQKSRFVCPRLSFKKIEKTAILELNLRKIYKTTTPDPAISVHFNHERDFLMQAFFSIIPEAVPAPPGKIVAQAVNIPVIGIDEEKQEKTKPERA